MTERTIQMLQTLEKEGYGIGDLKNLISEMDSSSTATLTSCTEENTEKRVSKILVELGMQTNIKGYYYCKTAICMAYEDSSMLEAMTKCLYPEVAKKHNTTGSRVERSIRHAIENLFNNAYPEDFYKFFGNNSIYRRGKPTNSEFITAIVEYMRMEDL